MISWRSFTTSKVLPTFVGESGYSCTYSGSNTSPPPNLTGTEIARVHGSASGSSRLERNRTLTSVNYTASRIRYFTDEFRNEFELNDTQGLSACTSVTENSTIRRRNESFEDGTRERIPTINSSPLVTIRQQTTETESFESNYRTTKTESAFDDGEGNFTPYESYVWTTTIVEIDTISVTSVTEITTNATLTVMDFKTRPGSRTITTTTGGDIQFKTYTAIDGNVEVVAHTIYELNSNTFAALVASPNQIPITGATYAASRFTVSFSDSYVETLTFLKDASERTQTTTQTTTLKTDHPTTRQKFEQETWKQWFRDFESQVSCDPEREIYRTSARSTPYIHQKTASEETITNISVTTFQTFNGFSTETNLTNRFGYNAYVPIDATSTNNAGAFQQRIRTFTSIFSFTQETTTFAISGNFTTTTTADLPGLIIKNQFPWTTFGDGAKRLYTVSTEFDIITTTETTTNPITTFSDAGNIQNTETFLPFGERFKVTIGSSTENLNFIEVKSGIFYRKNQNITVFTNTATAIGAAQIQGLASPSLTYETKNSHSSVGIHMSANAQHAWDGQNEQASISRSVVGAIPFYPTFTGIISNNAEGWELCDSTEYTTVRGSRVGDQFSTTIAWQTIEGTKTKNSTSSGSFTVNSTGSAEFGVRIDSPTIAGGFQTPNASRTVIVSPGAVLATTYDASGSGTVSASLSTGTTYSSALTGPQPITISSLIPRVQGRGVYTQRLLDNGLP
jgi:hypothetical protein